MKRLTDMNRFLQRLTKTAHIAVMYSFCGIQILTIKYKLQCRVRAINREKGSSS